MIPAQKAFSPHRKHLAAAQLEPHFIGNRFPWRVLLLVLVLSGSTSLQAQTSPFWRFGSTNGVPNKLVWQTKPDMSYDLWRSDDLTSWTHVDGFPWAAAGATMEHAFTSGARGFYKIAEQVTAPEGFALIPAGPFVMGDESSGLVGGDNERPVHTVNLQAFYLATYEVTKALWDEVTLWGVQHGYTDLSAGGGKADDHPVHSITWFEMLKWCNVRSERDGLMPCYTVAGAVYRAGETVPDCNWQADGYRLPTEAEWEKAARGRSAGKICFFRH